MSKKSNVHPDYYKTAGRDRPDDAASARIERGITAKPVSRERPDRMAKGLYFQRPESAPPAPPGRPEDPSERKRSPRAATPKGSATRKAAAPRRTVRASKAGSTRRKPGTRKK